MSVKFITSIYSDLYGTEFGGRIGRSGHYRESLLSLLKMTDADFLCYTSEREFDSLKDFFYTQNNVSEKKLKLVIFDISNNKFKDLINQYKNIEETKKSDRCIEIQYLKFNWWWNEDKSYDYYYWIDAGLSHTGLFATKHLGKEGYYKQMFDCSLFNNVFLKNLIKKSNDKFLIIGKDNVRHFWSGTVGNHWYTDYDNSIHVIGGIFGGHKSLWDNVTTLFEDYAKNIIETDHTIPHEENIMSLMYFNHKELFEMLKFDHWWCRDNAPRETPDSFFENYVSFNKLFEELNGIYE
jgi:hypothetical protein